MPAVNEVRSSPPAAVRQLASWKLPATANSPATIIESALAYAERPVISTNFRPGAAALLHLVTRQSSRIPVIWVDTGFNSITTYRYIEALEKRWNLNLHVFTPRITAPRLTALNGRIPQPGDSGFEQFVTDAKLEPFQRAFAELAPDIWFTGIRNDQSAYRGTLGVVSAGHRNSTRVAPLYNWSAEDVSAYLSRHGIPDNTEYTDPTKPGEKLECGIQLLS